MKKNAKKILAISIIIAFALGVVLLLNSYLSKQNISIQEGCKNITIIIENRTVEPYQELYNKTVNTNAEFLGDFLKEIKDEIVLDYQDNQYGMYIRGFMNQNDNSEKGAYWMFEINGNYSETGADTTPIKDNDIVNFYLEIYSW